MAATNSSVELNPISDAGLGPTLLPFIDFEVVALKVHVVQLQQRVYIVYKSFCHPLSSHFKLAVRTAVQIFTERRIHDKLTSGRFM